MPKSKRRRREPSFAFGIFEFDEFAGWILQQYIRCCDGIDSALDNYAQAVEEAELPELNYPRAAISAAHDTSYLAILALGLHYSLLEDLMDGGYEPGDLMFKEPVARGVHA